MSATRKNWRYSHEPDFVPIDESPESAHINFVHEPDAEQTATEIHYAKRTASSKIASRNDMKYFSTAIVFTAATWGAVRIAPDSVASFIIFGVGTILAFGMMGHKSNGS